MFQMIGSENIHCCHCTILYKESLQGANVAYSVGGDANILPIEVAYVRLHRDLSKSVYKLPRNILKIHNLSK